MSAVAAPESLAALAASLDGDVVSPDDSTYDAARAVWNGDIDRRPAAVVFCQSRSDVVATVDYVRTNGLHVTVRSGGHSMAGLSVADGHVVIDLSRMKHIHVDPDARRAVAEAGVLGRDLDTATIQHELATTLGTVSHTGIAGLTLGGGMGWLMREHGLASDNLESVEIVTADGRTLKANRSENSELFWAACGGGGHFGVVTRFEYRLHPLARDVTWGQVLFTPAGAHKGFTVAREVAEQSNLSRNSMLLATTLPEDESVPPPLRGEFVFAYFGFSSDPADVASGWMQPVIDASDIFGSVDARSYLEIQQQFDDSNVHGVRAYSKGAFLTELSDDALEEFASITLELEGVDCLVYLQQLGGAVKARAAEATLIRGRHAPWVLNAIVRWTEDASAKAAKQWVHDIMARLRPFLSDGQPLNFNGDADAPGANSMFLTNAAVRLEKVRNEFDPSGMFAPRR